jgi:hypothetical protein
MNVNEGPKLIEAATRGHGVVTETISNRLGPGEPVGEDYEITRGRGEFRIVQFKGWNLGWGRKVRGNAGKGSEIERVQRTENKDVPEIGRHPLGYARRITANVETGT